MIEIPLHGNFPDCRMETCPFCRECANHCTAGDFRTEGGFTPQLTVEIEKVFCTGVAEDRGEGALTTQMVNGKRLLYYAPHFGNDYTPYPYAKQEFDFSHLEGRVLKSVKYNHGQMELDFDGVILTIKSHECGVLNFETTEPTEF